MTLECAAGDAVHSYGEPMVMQVYYEFMEQCRLGNNMIVHGCSTYAPEKLAPAPLLVLEEYVKHVCIPHGSVTKNSVDRGHDLDAEKYFPVLLEDGSVPSPILLPNMQPKFPKYVRTAYACTPAQWRVIMFMVVASVNSVFCAKRVCGMPTFLQRLSEKIIRKQ